MPKPLHQLKVAIVDYQPAKSNPFLPLYTCHHYIDVTQQFHTQSTDFKFESKQIITTVNSLSNAVSFSSTFFSNHNAAGKIISPTWTTGKNPFYPYTRNATSLILTNCLTPPASPTNTRISQPSLSPSSHTDTKASSPFFIIFIPLHDQLVHHPFITFNPLRLCLLRVQLLNESYIT